MSGGRGFVPIDCFVLGCCVAGFAEGNDRVANIPLWVMFEVGVRGGIIEV